MVVGVSYIQTVHVQLLEESPGQEETSAIGRSIIGETSSQSPFAQLSRVTLAQDLITSQSGEYYLSNNLLVSKSHYQSILGTVVLVLVLDDHPLSSVIVSLSFSSSSVLSLISLEVSFSLLNLNETHF